MTIHISELELWTDWAERDDCFNLFVPNDIRQMLGEITRLRAALTEIRTLNSDIHHLASARDIARRAVPPTGR